MRRKTHTSRAPGPTETEIALKWELDRLRKENDRLRRQPLSRDPDCPTREQFKKMGGNFGRLWYNAVRHHVPEGAVLSDEIIMAAFEAFGHAEAVARYGPEPEDG